MTTDRALCLICAWRGDCKKKFKSESNIHCPDFSRDISIKDPEPEKALKNEKKGEVKKKKSGFWPPL